MIKITASLNLIAGNLERLQRVAATCHNLKDVANTAVSLLIADVSNLTSSYKMLKNAINLSSFYFTLHKTLTCVQTAYSKQITKVKNSLTKNVCICGIMELITGFYYHINLSVRLRDAVGP